MPSDGPDKQPRENPKPGATSGQSADQPGDPIDLGSMEASFWDESQIQAVVRHAGAMGLSPEQFFNKKWKDRLIHEKKAGGAGGESKAEVESE